MNFFYCLFFLLFMNSILLMIFGMLFIWLNFIYLIEFYLFDLFSCNILMLILLDYKSLLFSSIVLIISSMIMLYSNVYMSNEIYKKRFLTLVFMFILSMLLLIMSPNMISIMLGWDGLGLISFCLVIYYQNKKSLNSGILTALMNRIGDVMLLISIVWMMNYGSWNFLFYLSFINLDLSMYMVLFFVMMASITKSAQIPYCSWLPAAMAAPTPISALVHSSTLVTAGVYLMIRFNFFFSSSFIYYLLFFLSIFTMFMAGISANFEFNLKKIIALSTLSQLGMMMSILSLGMNLMGFFHLLSHALFKSMLFMCAGMFIHMMNNNQDIRKMGNLIEVMPITCLNFMIGNFSLMGIPFLTGFYSKDLIIEKMMFFGYNWIYYLIYFISLGLTVSYSIRLIYFLLLGSLNYMMFYFILDDYEVSWSMLGLVILSIIGGSILNWLIFYNLNFIYLSNMYKMTIYMFMFIGMILGFYLYYFKIFNFFFFMNMFYMPMLFSYGINYFLFMFNYKLMKNLDSGWLEEFGSIGFKKNLIFLIFSNQVFLFTFMNMFVFLLFMYIIYMLYYF
uniref:NADH-ubiquinone oxidoreductase chain 5 n=1 Tax=Nyctiophylax orbicularis TaxID=2904907 RepID=A0A9E8RT32_9NEOP|nr:NADH dehydrogenase subunit 5 [Nyctiophylax orbicularis]UZZ44207.1 NADH dehydrogenase subunit 5 [Nyctiophylax orbicularis]